MVFTGVKGDADAAFRDADYVRRGRFIVQRYTALPMEPRGVLAEWDAAQGRMTVLGAAKVPFFTVIPWRRCWACRRPRLT